MTRPRMSSPFWWTLSMTLASISCGSSPSMTDIDTPQLGDDAGSPDAGQGSPDAGGAAGECTPVQSSERLPARSAVLEGRVGSRTRRFPVDDLWQQFFTHCGNCHVENGLGGYRCSRNVAQDETTRPFLDDCIDDVALATITSDEPVGNEAAGVPPFMPPPEFGGIPWNERGVGDPVRELHRLLTLWIEQGRPSEFFEVEETVGEAGSYGINREVGEALTNLGNCIPEPQMVGADVEEMERLDAFFQGVEGFEDLPKTLEGTDLSTFDSARLAATGVIAYQTAYPLWSDDAAKLRHIRLPVGAKIRFDPATKQFAIPNDARAYKTFLKRVIDDQGRESYRKMETRIIVARADGPEARSGGKYLPAAVYGTYVWNDDETQATLSEDPLRNGEPFRDRLVSYNVDEVRATEIIEQFPNGAQDRLRSEGAGRTYAVPGSNRCEQCHMGSPSGDFLLGLSPLQLHIRPPGEGGALEDRRADEVSQMRRLVEYALVEGWDDTDPGVRLETSQPGREARTNEELVAQGYMVGNCAYCHNPDGFASFTIPEIRDVLRFYPDQNRGGIFEFPLERTSPRSFSGENADKPVAYISPSLRMDGVTPRFTVNNELFPIDAPWRSMIWRNASTPFTYDEDFLVYPKMPQHVPGHDCRAGRILGEWMVSLPARELEPSHPDYAPWQPFIYVPEGSADRAASEMEARDRLERFRSSPAFWYCPDGDDIVDRTVSPDGIGRTVPRNRDVLIRDRDWPGEGLVTLLREWLAPESPHWFVFDPTELPPPWLPRRPDWDEVLVDGSQVTDSRTEEVAVELLRDVAYTEALRSFALQATPFAPWREDLGCDFDSNPLSAVAPRASSFVGNARPKWMRERVDLNPSSPVWSISPGALTFNLVCANCHGQSGDSSSNLARTISDLTGGRTRVADLRAGLFGPDAPQANTATTSNIVRVFGSAAGANGSAEDWAVRYTTWMGLGGTDRSIPEPVLRTIARVPAADQSRANKDISYLGGFSANMLSIVEGFCRMLLPLNVSMQNGNLQVSIVEAFRQFDTDIGDLRKTATERIPLLRENGDKEMWERICSFDNPPPIRMIRPLNGWQQNNSIIQREMRVVRFFRSEDALGSSIYPASAWVGDGRGQVVQGLLGRTAAQPLPDNLLPWCIQRPTTPAELEQAEAFRQDPVIRRGRPPLPFCPEALTDPIDATGRPLHEMTNDDLYRWAVRGAINGGAVVFAYLREQLARGQPPPPNFNECLEVQATR